MNGRQLGNAGIQVQTCSSDCDGDGTVYQDWLIASKTNGTILKWKVILRVIFSFFLGGGGCVYVLDSLLWIWFCSYGLSVSVWAKWHPSVLLLIFVLLFVLLKGQCVHARDNGSPVEYLLSLLRTLPLRQPRLRDERWEEDRRARGERGATLGMGWKKVRVQGWERRRFERWRECKQSQEEASQGLANKILEGKRGGIVRDEREREEERRRVYSFQLSLGVVIMGLGTCCGSACSLEPRYSVSDLSAK